jgi:hypothetical protein
MSPMEEVQLAIDMGIESSLEFVLLAKINAKYHADGYYGYFNEKRVWLSCVAPGKLSKFETEYADYRCWSKYPNIKQAYLSGMLKDNNLFIREPWDNRFDKPYPKNYFSDELVRLKYELKILKDNKDWYAVKAGLDDKNSDYFLIMYDRLVEEEGTLTKRFLYLKRKKDALENGLKIDESKDFDIPTLKAIPLTDFVEVNRAGFFRVRLDDKTPSCKYYKDTNTWVDFGGDNKRHDVIDLICVLHNINFREACLFLLGK